MSDSFLNSKNAPHLVLGVQSIASQQDAVTAFALRSRKVKSGQSNLFTMEDLTAALSEIETRFRTDSPSLSYAIPANPSAVNTSATFWYDNSTYDHNSNLLEIKTIEISSDQQESAGAVYLSAAIQQLLEWNWETAAILGKECLRLSKREDIRDEALNTLAASFALQGDLTRSLEALKKAVDGEWNLALQTNLAIVATEEDPSLAVTHMSYIVDGARDISERLLATRLAIQLWRSTEAEETGSDDEDDFAPLPRALLTSMYSLIRGHEISEEDFYEIGMFLARVDSDYLQKSQVLQEAHHSGSLSAQTIKARANDFPSYLKALGGIAAQDPLRTKEWIHRALDLQISSLNSILVDTESNKSFAAAIAFSIIEGGLDCSSFPRISLRPLLTLQIDEVLDTNALPSEKFITWHREVASALASGEAHLTEDQHEVLRGLHERSGNYLAFYSHKALLTNGAGIERGVNSVRNRMSGFLNRLSADKTEVREVSNSLWQACNETIKRYQLLIPLVTIPEIQKEMTSTLRTFEQLKITISAYR